MNFQGISLLWKKDKEFVAIINEGRTWHYCYVPAFFHYREGNKLEKNIIFDFVIVAEMRWKLSKEPDIFSIQCKVLPLM